MRTKQEVINFLESKVGTKVVCVGNSSLDGQCVTLIKSLMEFIGVPNPYKARGHAKTCISSYLSESIAKPGLGFLSVFSNKDMGAGYGHIWCNSGDGDGTYYESNGQKPLIVTKGKTYSYDAVCNFDQYINNTESNPMMQIEEAKFTELVTKATKYDEFVKAGYSSIEQVKVKTTELSSTISDYDRTIVDLKLQIKTLTESQTPAVPVETGLVEAEQILAKMLPNGGKKIVGPDGEETIEISYKLA